MQICVCSMYIIYCMFFDPSTLTAMMNRRAITQRNIPICHAVTDRHIYTQYIFCGHLSGILLHGVLHTKN